MFASIVRGTMLVALATATSTGCSTRPLTASPALRLDRPQRHPPAPRRDVRLPNEPRNESDRQTAEAEVRGVGAVGTSGRAEQDDASPVSTSGSVTIVATGPANEAR